MNPSRRPSLQGKSPPLPSEQQEPSESERGINRYETCIVFICRSLRKHIDQNDGTFSMQDLKDLDKSAVTVLRYIRKHIKQGEGQLEAIKAELEASQANCAHEKLMREEIAQQLSIVQTRNNEIRQQMARKEKQCKGLVEKLVAQLHKAQKLFEEEQRRMQAEITAANKALQKVVEQRKGAVGVANQLKQLVGQIEFRRENSMISSKDVGEMSLDELGDGTPADNNWDEQAGGSLEQQLQLRLSNLICFGLFEPNNEKYLRQMIEMTAKLDHPSQLLEWGTYPIIAEMLVTNMKRHNQTGGCWTEEGEIKQGGRVQLRNINNLSELSIGDSHCQENPPPGHPPIFKRKQP